MLAASCGSAPGSALRVFAPYLCRAPSQAVAVLYFRPNSLAFVPQGRETRGLKTTERIPATASVLSWKAFRVQSSQASAMASYDIEVFGKAAAGTGSPSTVRGDCPFSQRTYMDLEEKGLQYKATYIEEGPGKPQWFMENNPSGLMPVLRDGEKWIQDSDKIIDYLEEKFPEHPLKGPDHLKSVGAGVFQTFTQWLQSKDANSPAKHDFEKELAALNEHLKSNGPFVAGEKFTDLDCALVPKLLHSRVALGHYYGYKFPDNRTALQSYMQEVENCPSFKKTSYPNDMIVKGWQLKFQLPDSMVPQGQSV